MASSDLAAAMVGMCWPAERPDSRHTKWRESISRLASRQPLPLRQGNWSNGRWATRGEPKSSFEADGLTVTLDGWIDNLDELLRDTDRVGNPDGSSSAELVANAYSRHGDALFARLLGSFALVLADEVEGEVFLVRDRFGSRPLYFGKAGQGWAWASEIKCVCPLLDETSLDEDGLTQAIRFRYSIGNTVVRGITQVAPACFVRLSAAGPAVETNYWSLTFAQESRRDSVDEWADRVDAALTSSLTSVSRRFRDVGILLSGGVDSSLLALKSAQAGFRRIVAFTARWSGENPELDSAIAVARHLGLEHRIIDLDDAFIAAAYPWLVWRIEEPPRHYNSFVLAKLFQAAATHVDVLLSGHAADILFGSSNTILMTRFGNAQSILRPVPRGMRSTLARSLSTRKNTRFKRWHKYLQGNERDLLTNYFSIDYAGIGPAIFGAKTFKARMGRSSLNRLYVPEDRLTERFQRFAMYTYDQSHMAVFERCASPLGTSVAMPFVMPELVEVSRRLPSHLKADRTTAKPVLKRLASRHFPRDWIYRRKQGFPTQTEQWLNGPLLRWRHAFEDDRTAARGLVDTPTLRSADAHRYFEAIWTSMTLETTCRHLIDGERGPPSLEQ